MSSRAALTTPPLSERLLRQRPQVTRPRPCCERTGHTPCRSLAGAREPLRPLVEPYALEDAGERAHRDPLSDILLRLRSEVQQHGRDVDLDGADLVAGTAEARRIGQRLRVLHTTKLRCED